MSVRFPKKAIHHFKLTKMKNKDSWSVHNKSYKSLQAVVQNFQKNPLVYKSEKKQTLSKSASTEIVTVTDNSYDYDDYYADGDYGDGEVAYYNV